MKEWDVYVDIFEVTKTLQEVNGLKEIPGRRDRGIGKLLKDPISALDFKDLRDLRKTTSCKETRESPSCFSSLIGQKKIFLANQKQAIQTLLELVR